MPNIVVLGVPFSVDPKKIVYLGKNIEDIVKDVLDLPEGSATSFFIPDQRSIDVHKIACFIYLRDLENRTEGVKGKLKSEIADYLHNFSISELPSSEKPRHVDVILRLFPSDDMEHILISPLK